MKSFLHPFYFVFLIYILRELFSFRFHTRFLYFHLSLMEFLSIFFLQVREDGRTKRYTAVAVIVVVVVVVIIVVVLVLFILLFAPLIISSIGALHNEEPRRLAATQGHRRSSPIFITLGSVQIASRCKHTRRPSGRHH